MSSQNPTLAPEVECPDGVIRVFSALGRVSLVVDEGNNVAVVTLTPDVVSALLRLLEPYAHTPGRVERVMVAEVKRHNVCGECGIAGGHAHRCALSYVHPIVNGHEA